MNVPRGFGALLLLASLVAGSVHAQCVSSPKLQPAATLPHLAGHLAFQSRNSTSGDSALYMYDFKTHVLQEIGTTWGITQPLNPDYSPDGKFLTFTGVQNGKHQVFAWTIGTALPVNLTLNMAANRSEDPKFSFDQQYIIFKQDGNIRRMSLGVDGAGNLMALSVQPVTTGGMLNGTYQEASAPFLTQDGQTAYYFRGSPSSTTYPSHIYLTSIKTLREQQNPSYGLSAEYYPIINYHSAGGILFYVGHNPPQGANDQIYRKVGTVAPKQLTLNDCNSNNSDPTAVNASQIIFAGTRQDGRYELYLGNINTGAVWSLTSIGVNAPPNDLEGASYSPY